jgi:hypothetical protein
LNLRCAERRPSWTAARRISLLIAATCVVFVERTQADAPWQLFVESRRRATLSVDDPRPGAVSVRIEAAADAKAGEIALSRGGISVRKDSVYQVRFAARSEDPRPVNVALHQNHAPWQPLALTSRVGLAREWRDFQVLFHPQADEPDAQVSFQLGASESDVQIADVSFAPFDPAAASEDSLRFPAGVWQIATTSDAAATLLETGPDSFRVELGDLATLEDWHVHVWTGGIPVQADVRYVLRLRLRADDLRVVVAALSQNHPPWRPLGLRAPMVATPEWTERTVEFIPSRTDLNAKLQLLLGGSETPVEFSEVRLELASEPSGAAFSITTAVAGLTLAAGACALGYRYWRRRRSPPHAPAEPAAPVALRKP